MLADGICEDGAGKAAGPRFVRLRIPERSFRGVDIGSVPPWRDGKREALAPIRQPPASSRVDAVVSAPSSFVPSPSSGQGDANCESGARTLGRPVLTRLSVVAYSHYCLKYSSVLTGPTRGRMWKLYQCPSQSRSVPLERHAVNGEPQYRHRKCDTWRTDNYTALTGKPWAHAGDRGRIFRGLRCGDRSEMASVWRDAERRCGVHALSFHSLRHTTTSILKMPA